MFAYATLGSHDFQVSTKFYDAVLAALGHVRVADYSEGGWIGYGQPGSENDPSAQMFWLCKTPFDAKPAVAGNGNMLCFRAPSRAVVDKTYQIALSNGGSSEGAPGIRENYGPDFYIAYVRDPMGNKFSLICRGA
jgi:catechol 2,3-dioxygenase-like lactoylglutathione lyase family enzyme